MRANPTDMISNRSGLIPQVADMHRRVIPLVGRNDSSDMQKLDSFD